MSDDTLQDQIQLLANTVAMVGHLQAASTYALELAKKGLEGADPKVMKGSAPDAAIITLALEALDKGREGAIATMILSEKAVLLKTKIENLYSVRNLKGAKDGDGGSEAG